MRFLIILMLFCTQSCKKEIVESKNYEDKDSVYVDEVSTISSISNYDSITHLVKIKGDTIAFDELFYYLKDTNEAGRTDTLMYYSKIMAEKHKNILAHYYYLEAICEKYNVSFENYNFSVLNISSLKDLEKKEIENWLEMMLQKKIITKEQYLSVQK